MIKKSITKTIKKTNTQNTSKKQTKDLSFKSVEDSGVDGNDYETETIDDIDTAIDDNDTETIDNINIDKELDNNDDELENDEIDTEENHDEDIASEVSENDNDECIYRKIKNLEDDNDIDDDDDEIVFDDDVDNTNNEEIILKPENRISKPYMTIFERVRLLGDRAKQLSLGAKPMIKGLETMDPKEIAKLELEQGVIPLIIERTLPNGKKERWHVKELKIIN